jgi:WD40 repeat protein
VLRVGRSLFGVATLACLSIATAKPMTRWKLGPAFPGHSATALAFSPDGHSWAAADGAQLHLGRDATLVKTLYVAGGTPVGPLHFAADGRELYWGAAKFSIDAGEVPTPRADVELVVRRALASDSFELRAAVDELGAVAIGRTRPSLRPGDRHAAPRGCVVALDLGGTARTLWTGPVEGTPSVIALDAQRIAVGGANLLVFERQSGRIVLDAARPHAQGTINALVLVDRTLYSAGSDGAIRVWEPSSAKPRAQAKVGTEPLRTLAVDTHHKLLAVGGWDDRVRLYTLPDLSGASAEIALPAHVEALAFAPDGRRLLVALGGALGAIQLLELTDVP